MTDPPSTPSSSNRSSIPRKKKAGFTTPSGTSASPTQQRGRGYSTNTPGLTQSRRGIDKSPSIPSIPASPSVRWIHSRRHSRQQPPTAPSLLPEFIPQSTTIPPKTPRITITPPSSSPETTPGTPTYRSTGSSPVTTYSPSDTDIPASSPPRPPLRTSPPRIPSTFRPPPRPRQASPKLIPSSHIPRSPSRHPLQAPPTRTFSPRPHPEASYTPHRIPHPYPHPHPPPPSSRRPQLKLSTSSVTPRPYPAHPPHKPPNMPHPTSPLSSHPRPSLRKNHSDLPPLPSAHSPNPTTPRTGSAPPATSYRPKLALNTSQGPRSIHTEGASPSRLPVPTRNLGSPRSEGALSPRSPRARDEIGRRLEREALESFRDLKSVGLERERRGRFGGHLRQKVEPDLTEQEVVVVLESSEDEPDEEDETERIPPEEEEDLPPEERFLRKSAAMSSAGVGLRPPLFDRSPRRGYSKEGRKSNNSNNKEDGHHPFNNPAVLLSPKKHYKESPSLTEKKRSFFNNSLFVVQNPQTRTKKSPTMKPGAPSLTIGTSSPSTPFLPALSPSLDPKTHGYDSEHPYVYKLHIDDSIPHIVIQHKREGICIHSTHPTHGIIGSLLPSTPPGAEGISSSASSTSSTTTTEITTYTFRLAPLPGCTPLDPSSLTQQTIHAPPGMRFRQGRLLCIYDHAVRGKAEEAMEANLRGGETEEKALKLREGRGGARRYWKERAARWVFLEVVGGREEGAGWE